MKNISLRMRLPAALLCLATALHTAMSQEIDQRNLVGNGSFEEAPDDGAPARWKLRAADGLAWALDREVKHSGEQALRLTGDGVRAGWGGFSCDTRIDLKANRVYELSLWVKAEDADYANPGGYLWRSWPAVDKSQRLPNFHLCIAKGTYDWRRITQTYKSFVAARLNVSVPRPVIAGTVWLDDVVLREVGVIPSFPAPNASAVLNRHPDAVRSPDAQLAVLFAPATRKIGRGMPPDTDVFSAGRAGSVALARNEHEPVQLVLAPLWERGVTRRVRVDVGPLLGRSSDRPAAGARVTWHAVGYLGTQDQGRLISTPWPDVLLSSDTFAVRGQELQPIWLDVYAGENTPPGDYRFKLTVILEGADALEASVDVHVYSFALPQEHTLPTAFGANLPGSRKMIYEHRLASRRLIGFLSIPGFHPTEPKKHVFGEFAEVIPAFETRLNEHIAKGGTMFLMEMPNFPGAYSGGVFSPGGFSHHRISYDATESAYVVRYYRQLAEWLREKNLLEYGYVYLWDEPARERFGNIHQLRELIREADPKIHCMVVTTLEEELVGAVDIWVTQSPDWVRKQDLARRLAERGEPVWWYNEDALEMEPAHDLLEARLLVWALWKYRVEGLLHWAVDHWRSGSGPLLRIGDTTDCWWKGGLGYYLGLGSLVVPSPGNPERMLPTIRLAALRDGLEDHVYFTLLKTAIEHAEGDPTLKTAAEKARRLLQVPDEIVIGPRSYTTSDTLMRAHRDAVARAIEQLTEQ